MQCPDTAEVTLRYGWKIAVRVEYTFKVPLATMTPGILSRHDMVLPKGKVGIGILFRNEEGSSARMLYKISPSLVEVNGYIFKFHRKQSNYKKNIK